MAAAPDCPSRASRARAAKTVASSSRWGASRSDVATTVWPSSGLMSAETKPSPKRTPDEVLGGGAGRALTTRPRGGTRPWPHRMGATASAGAPEVEGRAHVRGGEPCPPRLVRRNDMARGAHDRMGRNRPRSGRATGLTSATATTGASAAEGARAEANRIIAEAMPHAPIWLTASRRCWMKNAIRRQESACWRPALWVLIVQGRGNIGSVQQDRPGRLVMFEVPLLVQGDDRACGRSRELRSDEPRDRRDRQPRRSRDRRGRGSRRRGGGARLSGLVAHGAKPNGGPASCAGRLPPGIAQPAPPSWRPWRTRPAPQRPGPASTSSLAPPCCGTRPR